MLPWAMRRRSASGAMSTSSIWSAARTTSSGTVSRCLTPVIVLDDVVERLEVLDVHGRDDVDAGVEQLFDVLPALLVARARDVGVGQLVDQGDLRTAGQHGVEVHLLEESCPRYVSAPAGYDLEVADLGVGVGPVVGLDEADDHVGAALRAPPALVEHGVGLAHARRRTEVDAQLSPGHPGLL